MGQFKIEITAQGAHGCQRDKKDGDSVVGCQHMYCPDCLTREFVEKMRSKFHVEAATFTHWPGSDTQVVDDLLTKKRTGHF